MAAGGNSTSSIYSGYSPTSVEVPVGQPVRLPNPPGQGGVLITNKDSVYSVDVAPTSAFVTSQTATIPAGLPINWPEGSLWCRVTPGQSGALGVEVFVQPAGAQATPSTSALTQVAIPQPPAGQDFTYTLQQTVRIVGFVAILTTSKTDLAPTLLIGPSPFLNVIMVPATLPAGGSVLTGFEAAALAFNTTAMRGTFPLPNLLLAGGTTLESTTANIGGSDQWSAVTFWVSPA